MAAAAVAGTTDVIERIDRPFRYLLALLRDGSMPVDVDYPFLRFPFLTALPSFLLASSCLVPAPVPAPVPYASLGAGLAIHSRWPFTIHCE